MAPKIFLYPLIQSPNWTECQDDVQPAVGKFQQRLTGECGIELAEKRLEERVPLASGTVGRFVNEAIKRDIAVSIELP
ncbi:hypothetical protein J2Z31_000842 [Sinorhizobium kostiense]|uniref:Uncharacterized protein n=1 Tax=Sinorhizobium kostiense TaxID=76747 RepID=A0ABS4QUM9_9HYPH|nr:hypothetical protein [Sinorhizobium kostiense]